MNEYVNYHRHSIASNISSPDSTLTINDYLKRAKELNHTCLSTVEHGWHGGLSFILEAYDVCKKNNMKLLIGAEGYFVKNRYEKDKSNYHIIIMCLNEEGRKELNLALSEANMTGYYYKPRLDYELMFNLSPKNFIITSACVSGLVNDEETIVKMKEHFGKNFFLEVQSHNHPTQIAYNKKILELSDKYNIEIIHGCDTHYITEQDKFNRNILLKGKGMNYGDEEEFEIDYPSYDEIVKRYEKQGVLNKKQIEKALKNTLVIKDKTEDFVFNDDIKMPTLFPNKTHEEKVKKLKGVINKEFKKQYPNLSESEKQKYFNALRLEMNIIEETYMEDYFLDNYYIIKRAKKLGGVLTQTGRGSAVSFLTNKLLGFTSIDRLQEKIELYPSRFMSKSRILETRSLPDIDHNLVDQKPFVDATREILGEHGCYIMVSYGYQKEKSCIKNVCRALNISPDEANNITKDIESSRKNNKYEELFRIVDSMGENIIESMSPNACGHLLLSDDIRKEIGVMKVGDTYCAMIDKNTADKWKYLKNDYLIVSVWLLISEVYKEIGKPIDSIKDLKEMTMNDEKVWKLYEDGITATLNQTSTESGRSQVMIYKPQNVEELSHFVAGIRPSFESQKSYLLNRKEFSYGIPEFDELLKTSMNFVLYQESIMSALIYAGIPEDETYSIIKAISKKKKDIIMKAKDRFIKGFTDKTGSEENAERVWKIIEDASAYGFNSSHALSVAYDSLYGAYLKANYPLQYYAVALNINEGNETITHDLTEELKYFGISLSDIRFRYSRAKYSYDLDNKILYKGLKSIKFLNEQVAEELYNLKDFKGDFVDLLKIITETTSCNSRQMVILIKLGYFKEFGGAKYLFDIYTLFSKRFKKTHIEKTKAKRIDEIKETIKDYKNEELSVQERIQTELEFLGYCTLKDDNFKSTIGAVTDISDKYATRWITVYHVKTGNTCKYKIKKQLIDELGLKVGDIINLKQITERPKNILIDGKWTQDKTQMELYITEIKKVRI